jgi:hypothetical protein|tara:strand:- start:16845 stop:17438 length:594 start_codon:yes stop_codon:yes gene_type:complete
MAIPNGTKFHGVAPEVPTENLGSASLNAKRNVYTYPQDFETGIYTYTGAVINFGAGATAPFNGDTVEWGGISSPTSQTAVIVFPETVEITHLYAKVLQPVNTSGGFDYVFKLYKSPDVLLGDPNQAGTWTTVSSDVGGNLGDDGTAAWGLDSGDLTGNGLVIPANNMMAMAGILQGGSIGGSTTDAIVGIVAKSFTP